MKTLAPDYPLQELAWALDVSRSGYYRWRKGVESPRTRLARQLTGQIADIHGQSRQTYGSPRVFQHLVRQGVRTSENRVARLMRRAGLKARTKRAFRPRTTDSRHPHRPAPNLLAQGPPPQAPNQVWVADITYIWTLTGWVYLAAVMDLCSRKIVGWSIGPSLETTLVKEALKQALRDRRPAPGLLHHSDRGVQYASSAFEALLHSWKIIPSMSAQGHCYDNAAMEAFWSTLKTEWVHLKEFSDLDAARLAIFDYIEIFYNRKRLHSALGFKSPVEFEQKLLYKNN
jgi:transposase InsO family protein